MQFRSATEKDAEAIALLHALSWQRTYRGMMPDGFLQNEVVADRLAEWQARMREDRVDRLVYLAIDGERLAGFICAFGNEDAQWGSLIDNLHVDADYQGSGLGAELMAGAGRWLHQHHPDAGVYLWVFEANLAARGFYERLGGSNRETQPDPGGGSALCCRYTWNHPRLLVPD